MKELNKQAFEVKEEQRHREENLINNFEILGDEFKSNLSKEEEKEAERPATATLDEAFQQTFGEMFSTSSAYDKVMGKNYVPVKRELSPEEKSDFEMRKSTSGNKLLTENLHSFQKKAADYVKGDYPSEKINKRYAEFSEGDEKTKNALLGEEMKNFLAIKPSLSMLNEDYMANHFSTIVDLKTNFERMKTFRNDPLFAGYFDGMYVNQKAQFDAMYNAVESLVKCIDLTLKSHGLNPDIEELAKKGSLEYKGDHFPEGEKSVKGYKKDLKNGVNETRDNLKKLAKTFRYNEKSRDAINFNSYRQTRNLDRFNALSKEQREKLRIKNKYTIKKISKKRQEENKRKVKADQYINDVSGALLKIMPETYKGMHDALTDENAEEKNVELVHSKGTRLLMQGHDVLEIDVAGSGFEQFSKHYNGVRGVSDATEDELEEIYGKRVDPNSKYIRQKTKDVNVKVGDQEVKRNKTRITMPGPLGGAITQKFKQGMLNQGDFRIERTRERIRDFGSKYLKNIFSKWNVENGEKPHDVDLIIRGHSRGAVGVSQGSMALKYWLHTTYPEYESHVKFHVIQMDPVPGGDVETLQDATEHQFEHFDYENYQGVHDGTFTMGGVKMMPVGAEASSTVVYSMVNQNDFGHRNLFKPQEVLNARKVVLTPFTHDVGMDLDHADHSQMDGTQAEKAHAMAYYDATSGKVYRNTGIDDLDDGVYVMDENQVMVRIDSMDQLKAILALTMPQKDQKERQERILRAAESVLRRREAQNMDYASINHKKSQELFDTIQKDVGVFASSYRKAVSRSINKLRDKLKTKASRDEVLKAYDELITATDHYIDQRSHEAKATKAGKNRLDWMRTLHQNMTNEKAHFAALSEKNDSANLESWDELFEIAPEVNISDATEYEGGVLRTQKGTHVTFAKKANEDEAVGMELTSRMSQHMGGDGVYQNARRAKLTDNEGTSDGIIFEQTYTMKLSDVMKDNKDVTYSPEAERALSKIRVMDLLLGIDDRFIDKNEGLRVKMKRDDSGKVTITDIKAQMCQTKAQKMPGGLGIVEEDQVKRLSDKAREFLAELNEQKVSDMLKWSGDETFKTNVMERFKDMKKVAKV